MSCTTIILNYSHLLLIILLVLPNTIESSINTLPGCIDSCGNIQVPYPFGIGAHCSFEGFGLNCTTYPNGTSTLHLNNIEILNISLATAEARINNHVSWQCYNISISGFSYSDWSMNLTNSPYRFSGSRNKFTTIGCDTLAYIRISNKVNDYQSGCVSVCDNSESLINNSCSGIGCCQTTIPKGISNYEVWFDSNFNNSDVYEFNRCSYAILVEDSNFSFDTSYITTNALFEQQMPMVLDWAIRNETCNTASKNTSSYMCKSDHSYCVNSINDLGYFCNCSSGYDGNPYLEGGCQDIDECADENNNPCSKPGRCHNTIGGYRCSCPFGSSASVPQGKCQLNVPLVIGMSIGTCIVVFLLLSLLFCIYVVHEKRKLKEIRQKYFQQHGGWELYDEIKANQGIGFTVFTKEELEQSTRKFDNTRVIGQGGFGTVYKGELKDRTVAIKKCKISSENQRREFGKEMLILSQINHKNIVKLLGFCLEVEVPMLVYEYITNGTLYQFIRAKNQISHISLETRLRIAQESAEALAYLHSSASPPIIHGDVKSSNILLDENFTVKISDFGASVLTLAGESHFATLVQGTQGYLDPEYLQKFELTPKSDVYSFGVILLELLMRKPVFYFDETEGEDKCLSSVFLSAMKDNQLEEMLDEEIKKDEDLEIIIQVAELAKECLNIKGEERPTMKEVAENLDKMIKIKQHPWGRYQREEVETLLGEASGYNEIESTTGYFSLEKKAVRDIESGR